MGTNSTIHAFAIRARKAAILDRGTLLERAR
jgi:hypothetical protein